MLPKPFSSTSKNSSPKHYVVNHLGNCLVLSQIRLVLIKRDSRRYLKFPSSPLRLGQTQDFAQELRRQTELEGRDRFQEYLGQHAMMRKQGIFLRTQLMPSPQLSTYINLYRSTYINWSQLRLTYWHTNTCLIASPFLPLLPVCPQCQSPHGACSLCDPIDWTHLTLRILPLEVDLLHGRYPSLLSRPWRGVSRIGFLGLSFTLHPCSDKIFSTDSDDDEVDNDDAGDAWWGWRWSW